MPVCAIHDEKALPRIVLHTQKRPQKASLRVMDFPPGHVIGMRCRDGLRKFGKLLATHEHVASAQRLRRVDVVHASEPHDGGGIVLRTDFLNDRATRHIEHGRHERHLHALLEQKRKARRASHDEPPI